MNDTADYDKSATPKAHASTHEAGGSDEIDITGLDPEPHASSHQDGGDDEVNVTDLSGELTDEQKSAWAKVTGKPSTFPPQAHKTAHQGGGGDEISVAALLGELTDEQKSAWAKVSGKPSTFPPEAHAATHKSGGGDEIDISGLVHTSVCRASLSATQDILNVTPTKVTLNVADIDRNSDFDTANNKFVVPSTGVYLLLGQIHWSAILANKHTTVSVRKNGATQAILDGHTGFTTAFGLACFTVASLTAGDDITLYAYQSTGFTQTLYSGVNRTQLIVVRLY